MSGSRFLVTGGRGYLGGRLLRDLPGAEALVGDVTDREGIMRAMAQAGPADAVLHLAAADEKTCAADPARAFSVNCVGTAHLLDAAVACAIPRVVLLSTFHVYGPVVDGSVITEQTLPNPRHLYGITKLAAEHVCRGAASRSGVVVAIARLSNGIGAPADAAIGRWSLVLLDLCRQAHEKGVLTLLSSGLQRRDFITLSDVVEALRLLCSAPAEAADDPVFNVESGSTISVRDLAELVRHEYQALYDRPIALTAPPHEGPVPVSFAYDQTRIRALGLRASTDFRSAVRETLQFCERFAS